MMRRRRVLSAADTASIAAEYAAGATIKALRTEWHCCHDKIVGAIVERGGQIRTAGRGDRLGEVNPRTVQMAEQYRARGSNAAARAAVAAEHGASPHTVARAVAVVEGSSSHVQYDRERWRKRKLA